MDLLGSSRLTSPEALRAAIMPASLGSFSEELVRRQETVDDLLTAGRGLVEAIERIVCGLYGLPDALTDLVVESAVARAATVAQGED